MAEYSPTLRLSSEPTRTPKPSQTPTRAPSPADNAPHNTEPNQDALSLSKTAQRLASAEGNQQLVLKDAIALIEELLSTLDELAATIEGIAENAEAQAKSENVAIAPDTHEATGSSLRQELATVIERLLDAERPGASLVNNAQTHLQISPETRLQGRNLLDAFKTSAGKTSAGKTGAGEVLVSVDGEVDLDALARLGGSERFDNQSETYNAVADAIDTISEILDDFLQDLSSHVTRTAQEADSLSAESANLLALRTRQQLSRSESLLTSDDTIREVLEQFRRA